MVYLPFFHIPVSVVGFFADKDGNDSPPNVHDGRRELVELFSDRSSGSSWLCGCESSQRQSSGRRPGAREVPLFNIWELTCYTTDRKLTI